MTPKQQRQRVLTVRDCERCALMQQQNLYNVIGSILESLTDKAASTLTQTMSGGLVTFTKPSPGGSVVFIPGAPDAFPTPTKVQGAGTAGALLIGSIIVDYGIPAIQRDAAVEALGTLQDAMTEVDKKTKTPCCQSSALSNLSQRITTEEPVGRHRI